jgi:hypothetical protein
VTRLALAVLVVAAAAGAACQASPSGPSGTATPYSLRPGSYTMTVYVPRDLAGVQVICVEQNDVPDTASFPVGVSTVAGGWRIQPAGEANLGLVALLSMYGPTVIGGPVFGQARDPDTGVTVSISPSIRPELGLQLDATLQGTLATAVFGAGVIAGDVQFARGGQARFCSPTYWMLRPRPS